MAKDESTQRDLQDAVPSDDAVGQPTETTAPDAPVGIPKKIGQFHIKRVIASGGMGTVYEAVQNHPRRTVAVKVMKQGIASRSALRRFEYESQTLARLHHPGIAQVYEAGTADEGTGPVPYFAMEYIPNPKTITEYVRIKKLGTRERLQLFMQVCEAVYHGHQKGIIHRDLKPANILVDSHGQVKIIDFGVARATDSDLAVTTLQTDVGQLIGTVQYMSPEQCEADPHDLDTRSDVYALGVVLYELLCDKPPYDVGKVAVYEAARVIREQPPTKLSTVNRALRGDVETIVLKALEKDRERRYQSADQFRQDIERYLKGEPISARPPSVPYQLRVFARRNKVLFGATVAVFVVLVTGVVVSSSLYFRAEREATRAEGEARKARQAETEQRRLAEKEAQASREAVAARALAEAQRAKAQEQADKATAVFGFLEDVLAEADPYVQAKPGITLREVIEQAGSRLGSRFTDQPLVEAKVRVLLGRVLANQGQFQAAEDHLERAVRTLEQHAEADPSELLVARAHWGGTLLALGKFEQLARLDDEIQRTLSLESAVKLLSQVDFSYMVKNAEHPWLRPLSQSGAEPAEGIVGVEHMLRLLEAISGGRSAAVALMRRALALIRRSQGDWAEAENNVRRALDIYHHVHGDEHVLIADGLYALAGVLGCKHEWTGAEENYRRCLQMRRKLLGEAHPDVACALMGIGWVQKEQARFAEAEGSLRDALSILREFHGSEDWFATLMAEVWLGEVLQKQGRQAEAEQLAREARELRGCVPGNEDPETLEYLIRMGSVLIAEGRAAEAEPYYREVLELTRKLRGRVHSDVALSLLIWANLLLENGDDISAETLLREAQRIDPDSVRVRSTLAALLYKKNDVEGAAQCHREILRRALAGENVFALNEASWRVVKYPNWDSELYALAVKAAHAAVSAAPGDSNILNTLGVARYRAGKFEEALATLRESDALKTSAQKGRAPADVAFIAMSLYQLGRTDEALAELNAFREIMKNERFNNDEESQSFLREAEALIDPSQPAAARPGTSQPATKPAGQDP